MFLHFSAKKVECAKHQWIHLVGDQPESPHAFENFVVNARWRSTWVRVYNSLTLQSSYKPSMHFMCRLGNRRFPPWVSSMAKNAMRRGWDTPVGEALGIPDPLWTSRALKKRHCPS